MTFEYYCDKCDKVFQEEHSIGEAPKKGACPKCGKKRERYYSSVNFSCDGPSSRMKFNREMTKRNEEAGRRMMKDKPDRVPNLVGYDRDGEFIPK